MGSENKIDVRFVTLNGNTYFRKEDVIELLTEFGGTEETDVCNRMQDLVNNLRKVEKPK